MIGLKGCGTALVTPFQENGELDLDAFRGLVEWQIESGIDFLVPCGTTGESVALDSAEYREVIRTCVRTAGGRVPVLAGAGSNNTVHAVSLARAAAQAGADGVLSVVPYYNKPTAEGLFRHFETISLQCPIPVVVYNVPARTATNISPGTLTRIARLDSVVGVKEASGDLNQIMRILSSRAEDFALFSGDDSLALATVAMGGDGVISVASNLIPSEMSCMISHGLRSSLQAAREIHYRYLELMHLNFVESNPIPVKYALSRLGRINPRWRLPLCPPSQDTRLGIDRELEKLGLLITT